LIGLLFGPSKRGSTVWIFKGLLFLALLFAMVFFFVTNSGQVVDINLFGKVFLGLSIYWVVAVSFMLGFLTNFVIASIKHFQHARHISHLNKQHVAKDREIAHLRTLPLSDSDQHTNLDGRDSASD
jgi:hypothetical protein